MSNAQRLMLTATPALYAASRMLLMSEMFDWEIGVASPFV
jgi:hypothetical protein